MIRLAALSAVFLLTGCTTLNGLAHGWRLAEAHCYPNGSVDCDNVERTGQCTCDEAPR